MGRLLHPMTIGDVTLQNNIALAPMAGVSDLPFRVLCQRMGAGLVCMEMISAKAIFYGNKNTDGLLKIDERENAVSLQLFGSDPQIMADMAKRIEELPFAVLDINMGCPVPKIVNNHEGSALMKNPVLAGEIIEAVSRAIKKPVTVKFRKGFDDEHINAVEFAKVAQNSGASALTVHGRTREQYYSGKADWDIIRQVKEAVSIPVFGNGDVVDGKSALELLEQTGCDGIMIGRASEGNPWIFEEVTSFLARVDAGVKAEDIPAYKVTNEAKKKLILEHAKLMLDVKGEYIGVREMRKHLSWYTTGLPDSARLRGRINLMESFEELEEAICEILDTK